MSTPSEGRLAAIDIVRGFCIVSMVSAHIAAGTLFARATHAMPAFDGASGFVLLSGLVLGIVQRKRLARDGLRSVEWKTVRRIGVILVAQVSLIVLGVVVALVARYEHRNVPPIFDMPASDVLVGAATLYLAPPSASVLRLYIVMMVLALGAYWLLARGRWILTLVASVALYGLGYLVPTVTSFRGYNSADLGANWATWQLLFIVAIVLGWHWRTLAVPERITRHAIPVTIGSGALIVTAFFGERLAPALYEKTMLAPGLFLNAYAVVTFLFLLTTWALRMLPRWLFRPIEMVGTRSLDSYIIQAGVAIIIPSFILFPPNTVIAAVVAVATLIVCWGWAEFRRSAMWPATVRRGRVARQSSQSAVHG